MGLTGDLKDFELNDIFQFIHMSGKDGVLHVHSDLGEGTIYFDRGNILHAEAGEHSGTDAISVLLTWDQGVFEFITGEKLDKVTIDLPVQSAILEAAKKIDERKKIEEVIPSIDAVVDFVAEPGLSEIELQPVEWKALSIINGEKTIKEISRELDLKPFQVIKILYDLAQSGLIKVVGEEK